MADKRIIKVAIYCFLLLIIFTVTRPKDMNDNSESLLYKKNGIVHLYVDGKELSDEYYTYLDSLADVRFIAAGQEYFDYFELRPEQSVLVSLHYDFDKEVNIYAGLMKDNMTRIFIRLENSDRIYEIKGEFFKILLEKPDPEREYSITDPINPSSVIAISLKDSEKNIFITENDDNEWRDQISGLPMNSLKVKNLINKIINLRAVHFSGDNKNIGEEFLKIKLEINDGSSRDFKFSFIGDDSILIINSDQREFLIKSDKLGFSRITFEDLK